MTHAVDFAARVRPALNVARVHEPDDVDKRARTFVATLAGALQEEDPILAAEVFNLLTNVHLLQLHGVNMLVTGVAK